MKVPKRRATFSFGMVVLLLVFSPVIAVVMVGVALFAIPRAYLVIIPIIRVIEQEPLYWMSAFETKRASGKSTENVLDTLMWSTQYEILECRFRDRDTVLRLERILKRKAPRRVYPIALNEVIFYEFRMKVRGGKRSKKRNYWRVLVPRYATT